ncbi:MAG: hypothetical protein GY796_22865 [Chloroflexi bacterium]|nr:hypothetical protein [Chloroflexota bacterium]
MPAKRPLAVTLIFWGVLLFGTWNGGRVMALYWQKELLLNLSSQPDPRLRLLIAGVWALLFFWLAWALRGKLPFTAHLIPAALTLYALLDLGMRWWGRPWQIDWFIIGFYILIISFTIWVFHRSAAKLYFKREGNN